MHEYLRRDSREGGCCFVGEGPSSSEPSAAAAPRLLYANNGKWKPECLGLKGLLKNIMRTTPSIYEKAPCMPFDI